MLQSIHIQNYALINKLDIKFNEGLNIITGETGAGKSILLGALSLILGQRADTTVLKDKTKKCFVEAQFEIGQYNLQTFFKKNDIDYDINLIIRREITDRGKSRAFINDTPVNLTMLKELSIRLIDIHSQHENLLLSDGEFQLSLMDSFANHNKLLTDYKVNFEKYQHLLIQYNKLINNAEKAKTDLDYYQFQFEQLEALKLVDGEQEELESDLEKLNHAEEIKINLSKGTYLLSEHEDSIISNLKQTKIAIDSIAKYIKQGSELRERIESVYIELKDINEEIETINEDIEHNPSQIQFLRERLDAIFTLQQKHNVKTIKDLLEIKEELQKKIENINSYDFETEKTKKELDKTYHKLTLMADEISANRKKVIPVIEKKVVNTLNSLAIKNPVFEIKQEPSTEFMSNGKEYIKFMFSANKNIKVEELAKVASGGEMSRLMISIKSLLVENITLPTIIFDEIDTGTSGEIADKMGTIIKQMSAKMQVINITHLPQIASKGDYHYLVYKQDNNETTNTYIKLLNKEERVNEIAKMLSGESLTDAAVQNAKVLLNGNEKHTLK